MTADLAAYLRVVAGRAFRFGRHDCTTVAAGWVRLATGRDLLADWPYRSLREGRGMLAARGHGDLAAAVDAVLPRVPVLAARQGDLVLIDGGLAIVAGAEAVGLRRPRGIAARPISAATHAWRVI